jgi:thiamine kinase-like enzyme
VVRLNKRQTEIVQRWDASHLADKIGSRLGLKPSTKLMLLEDNITRLKKNGRSVIWRLEVAAGERTIPIILKSFLNTHMNNMTEINVYEKAHHILEDFLPKIYHVEHGASVSKGRPVTWVFMEHVQMLHGQIPPEPEAYFDRVVPAVAAMHAHTFEHRFRGHADIFTPWFPVYTSGSIFRRRRERMAESLELLRQAVSTNRFSAVIRPVYPLLKQMLRRGPGFFPELVEAGQSITHGDLHSQNICCSDMRHDREWHIRYIDWEGAEFAPVWFDVIQLIEVLIDYRDDWHDRETELRGRYLTLYLKEMAKHGIVFHADPLQLYKMAYLQWMLEKGLNYELHDALNGEQEVILARYFEKLQSWGKELALYR